MRREPWSVCFLQNKASGSQKTCFAKLLCKITPLQAKIKNVTIIGAVILNATDSDRTFELWADGKGCKIVLEAHSIMTACL